MVDIVGAMTLGDAWDAAVRVGQDRSFLIYLDDDGARSEFTYRQFDQAVWQAAALFDSLGIGAGTVVAMQVCNSPEFLSCLLGLAKVGAVAVPLPLGATASELRALYRACRAEWAVVEADGYQMNAELRASEAILPGGLIGVHSGESASFEARCAAQTVPYARRAPIGSQAVVEVLFTSGTTAAPKGVLITHANMVYSGHYAVWQASLRPEDRVLAAMPACHSNFQLVALTGVIAATACLVLSRRYSARRFWADVRAERATVVQLTAMMVRTLLLQPANDHEAHHDVRETLYFMPLSDNDKQRFEQRFGVRFMNSYGSTESVCWAVTDPPQGERRWPSVGRAGLGYEVAIVGPDGGMLPPGEVGEFRIRGVPGRTLMAGYLDDPLATEATLSADGWLRTFDTGYYDADGWFYFVDRTINLIKRAGENISATEVETVLEEHPLVREAAVIGVPDPLRDQAVKAFVLLESGAKLDAGQLEAHCRKHLAAFKVPTVFEFVTDLPRTASMKISKQLLLGRTPTQ